MNVVMFKHTYTRRHRAHDVRRAQERATERAATMQGDAHGTAAVSG